MDADIDRVLVGREAIAQRLDELAGELTGDLLDESYSTRDAQELTLVPILTGSLIFVADLMRRLPHRLRIHLVSITSYPGPAVTSRGASVQQGLTNLPESLEGRHVVLVDDILDSGATLRLARDLVLERRPASVKTCVLLRKRRAAAMAFDVDYVAFDIPDAFVVGYGLDYDDLYRNLPEIVTLKRDALADAPGRPPVAE